jgi:hypothetical protein
MTRLSVLVPCLCLTACAAPSGRALLAPSELASPRAAAVRQEPSRMQTPKAPEWHPGQPLMQGFLGVSEYQRVSVDDGGSGRVDGDEGELDQIPLIGGGGQWKLGGERMDFGLEGLLSFGWRGDAEAFVIGGGGAAVAIDVDLFVFEIFGGPFASVFLGEKLRLYGAAGPLLQWADYSQEGNGLADDGSGFGAGWYARTGLEFVLPSRTLLGFGVRWSDSSVDLGSGLGDLELEGLQAVVTVSRGI